MGRSPAPWPGRPTVRRGRSLPGVRPARGAGTRAAADGVIEKAVESPAEAIDGAQLVVLAAPPTATIELVGRLGVGLRPALAPETVITDVASTKAAIVAAGARTACACCRMAATRWPAARRRATRLPPRTCSSAGRGSSSQPISMTSRRSWSSRCWRWPCPRDRSAWMRRATIWPLPRSATCRSSSPRRSPPRRPAPAADADALRRRRRAGRWHALSPLPLAGAT